MDWLIRIDQIKMFVHENNKLLSAKKYVLVLTIHLLCGICLGLLGKTPIIWSPTMAVFSIGLMIWYIGILRSDRSEQTKRFLGNGLSWCAFGVSAVVGAYFLWTGGTLKSLWVLVLFLGLFALFTWINLSVVWHKIKFGIFGKSKEFPIAVFGICGLLGALCNRYLIATLSPSAQLKMLAVIILILGLMLSFMSRFFLKAYYQHHVLEKYESLENDFVNSDAE